MADLVGTVLGGRYRIDCAIGAGGMGAVYGGVHLQLERPVAVKVLRDGDRALASRFEREAKLLSRLAHPNIVAVFDFGTTDSGEPYVVMERVAGGDLRSAIKRRERFAWQEASPILVQICRALAEAHAARIAHLDLKPENVMLTAKDGAADVVKVLDFGIARLVHGEASSENHATETATGAIIGTPAYISPEQINGVRTDVRSDLYSLGVVAYEMLTGRLPFDAKSSGNLLVAHITEKPRPPSAFVSDVPAWLDAWVMRLLEKAADARPTDGAAALALLEDASKSAPPPSSPSFPSSPPSPTPSSSSMPTNVAQAVSTPILSAQTAPTGVNAIGASTVAERRPLLQRAWPALLVVAAIAAFAGFQIVSRSGAPTYATGIAITMPASIDKADDLAAAKEVAETLTGRVLGHTTTLRWISTDLALTKMGLPTTNEYMSNPDLRNSLELCRRIKDINADFVVQMYVARERPGATMHVSVQFLDSADAEIWANNDDIAAASALEAIKATGEFVDKWVDAHRDEVLAVVARSAKERR